MATLGPSDLLELVTVDGRISAVTAVCGRLRRHDLGPVGPVLADIALVRTLLRRSWSAGAAHPGLTAPLDRLGRRLIPPTLARSARPVVVVHGPDLAGLPLGLVPALRARPSAIAPCLRSFAEQRSSLEPERRGAVFVAGPDLPAASAEVRASAAHHPSATILDGPAATVDRVLEALDAPLAHLACHGTVRHDSPLFSSLRLADGPLPIHLLPRAPTLPATVILSACDVGRPARAGGTHVLGLPAALLMLGVGAVVASNVAVPDAVTAEVMTELHGQLAAGLGPSAALAELRSADDGVRSLVAAAFTCHATSGGI